MEAVYGEQTYYSGGGKGAVSAAGASEHSAHVCHVRGIGAGAVYFRDQPGDCAFYERGGNPSVYRGD